MQTVSGSSSAAAQASVGNALSNPARPASFKKSRRVQNPSGCNIVLGGVKTYYPCAGYHLNENAAARQVDQMTVSVTLRHAQRRFHCRF